MSQKTEVETNPTPTPTPGRLLDYLIEKGGLKNDAGLSRELEVAPPVISKIRNLRLMPGAAIAIRIHKKFGISIGEIEFLGGITL